MDDPQDHLEALSQASTRRKSAAAELIRQRQAARRRRNHAILFVVVLAALAGVGYLGYQLTQNQPPPVVVEEKPVEADPGLIDRKTALENSWARVKDRQPTARYRPLLDAGRIHLQSIQDLWAQRKFGEASDHFAPLGATLKELERLDIARQAALNARDDAQAAATKAQEQQAPMLAAAHWSGAVQIFEEAGAKFGADEFESAAERWAAAQEAYGQAALAANEAAAVAAARKELETVLTRRFDRKTIEAHGGAAWQSLQGTIRSAEADVKVNRFTEARVKLQESIGQVGEVELAVQRELGQHYYALLCGYRAVDLLLRRAAGDAVGDVRWSAMRQGLDDVQLPPETVSAILSARDGDYPAQGSALLETAGEAIKARWGEAVYSSFVIGVHIRVIERLLAGDAESFARQDAAEARRSIVFIQKNAQTAGYPPPILETVKELAATLAIKPEYEAVRQSRQLWSSLVRTLDDFNEAVKLMPSPPTQSVGEAAPVGQ